MTTTRLRPSGAFVAMAVWTAGLWSACGPTEHYARTGNGSGADSGAGLDSGADASDARSASGGRPGNGGAGAQVMGSGGLGSGGSPGTGGSATGGGAATGGRGVGATGGSAPATGGSASATGGSGTGGVGGGGPLGTGGQGTGGAATGGSGPRVLSIDFVGGRTSAGGSGGAVLVPSAAMTPSEIAGVKPASHWNSAPGPSGSLATLALSDGTATSASAIWNAPTTPSNAGVWRIAYADAEGDVRMMSGYLDAAWSSVPSASVNLVTVSGLPATVTANGYDVYVYVLGDVPGSDSRSYQYGIGTTTITVNQSGPTSTTPPAPYPFAAAPDMGMGNYVVFRGLSGGSFTLTAKPVSATGSRFRAPVNGIQIISPPGS